MKQAVIDIFTGVVENIIEVDDNFALDGKMIVPAEPNVGIGWSYDGGAFLPPPEPIPTPADLAAYAARKRWEMEVGGCVWNGWPVHSDRESQSKIAAERLAVVAGERADPDGWKFADGVFRLLSNEDFAALSNAVRGHVRSCFAIEAGVLAGIAGGAVTTLEQIDAAFAV